MSINHDRWETANHRYLTAALEVVRSVLERRLEHPQKTSGRAKSACRPKGALEEAARDMPAPAALEILCAAFGLSPFERDVLLLCAGAEMDSRFGPLFIKAHGDSLMRYPTFGLALAALDNPHWSALAPDAPLRRWRLIEVGTADALTRSPLRIDERVLHYLAGVQHLDDRLTGMIEPLVDEEPLVPSHQEIADQIAALWSLSMGSSAIPAVQLCGDESAAKRAISMEACGALRLSVFALAAQFIPAGPGELEGLARLWQREAALSASALLVDCHKLDPSDRARAGAIAELIERVRGPLIIASPERERTRQRIAFSFDVRKPTPSEQRILWRDGLSAAGINPDGHVEAMVSQFNLAAPAIRAALVQALGREETLHESKASTAIARTGQALWDACREQARPRLDGLARRIESSHEWNDLVLPEAQQRALRDIAAHVRQRMKVYEDWGFARKGARGFGITVLFAGPSGTGKTLAAEVLANDLRLDLYRIDLSQVVNKYIGETEKNLQRVFTAAEEGGAILLFDEADALFGKRTEVRDSHDRYANIEINYLLTKMEEYRGLAILATNKKYLLDEAFLRRLRFHVEFGFPDVIHRERIWQRIFPPETPVDGLDTTKLARLNVAGGNIRNIALYAAFLAADSGEPVRMTHLLHASRSEYAKLGSTLTESEVRDWI